MDRPVQQCVHDALGVIASVKLSIWLAALCLGYLTYVVFHRIQDYQEADLALSRRHGCQLPPELTKRWPLGIDRITELWKSNSEGRLLEFLCSIAKEYDHESGNNGCQFLLFGPRAFYNLHPQNVETMLSKNFKDYGFGLRPAIFAPLLGKGIFTQEGPAWKHSRELLRKQFSRMQYQNVDRFREHVDNLISCLPTEGTVDLQPLFFNLTLDAATALLFGRSVYSLRISDDQDAENKEFAEGFNTAQEGLAKRFRIVPFHFLYNPPSFRRACRNVHRFVERYIRERQDEGRKASDGQSSWFLDQVAAESKTEVEIRDQLLNVLLAGRDSTACCLSWTFRLLVRHPKVLERLRREVSHVMGDFDLPTRDDFRKIPYLTCVVKESLRLYPPLPLNNREAVRTTILPTGGGPDGKSPMMNLFGADADKFRPERWETGELAGIGWAYFPFNGGPRQCLGEDFALMEVYYTTVRLLQTFSTIKLPDGEAIEPVGAEKQRLTLVLSSADGCRVSVSRST